jgi:predicted amidohydrolase YtcJ
MDDGRQWIDLREAGTSMPPLERAALSVNGKAARYLLDTAAWASVITAAAPAHDRAIVRAGAKEAGMRSLSRRELIKGAAAGAAAMAGGITLAGQGRGRGGGPPATPPGQTVGTGGDLGLVNGLFVDGQGVVASALTIRNGRIANVGQAMALGPDAPVINLGGRTVVPGLFDSHVHYTRAGVNPGYEARRIERAFSILELQETIARRAQSVPPGAFITCIGGWNHTQLAEARRPTKAELNEAAPQHAVYISATGGGTGAITNSLGQAFFTANGVAVDDASGVVGNAGAALAALQAVQTPADKLRGTADMNAHATSLGLTAVMNNGNFPDLEYPLQLWREDRLRIRMRPLYPADSPETVEARILNNFSHGGRPLGHDLFRVTGFGERIGGTDTMSPAFEPTARVIAQHRWMLYQHSISLVENDFHIAAFQSIARDHPIDGLRWALIHVQRIDGSRLYALKQLGAGALPQTWPYLGTAGGPPFRDILDSGVFTGGGTDSTNVAALDPWCALFYMTTGRNVAGILTNPGQQISRLEALRMYTEGSAYVAFEEHEMGSFEEGKYADLAVLSEDYLTVPDHRIRKIESLLTLVGGRVAHASGPFDGLAP